MENGKKNPPNAGKITMSGLKGDKKGQKRGTAASWALR